VPRVSLAMRLPHRCLLAIGLFAITCSIRAHDVASEMTSAANGFLQSLSPAQASKARYALKDNERENWNFVPMVRGGLPLKEMAPEQRALAFALLHTGLSDHGIKKAEAVISLENVLKELENGSDRRDPERYYVAIFGDPAHDKTWAWRFEGHHLSFNFSVDGQQVFFTPSFIGSNPAEVRSGPLKGLRVLGEEDDLGRALVTSLDESRQKVAIIAVDAPAEVITGNHRHIDPLSPEGIPASQLTPLQREKLSALLELYLHRYRSELSDPELAAIRADFDHVCFAWAGSLAPGVGHYYRLQGATFLCEFDDTQNNANHIHTVWRNFKNDFGGDALLEHYQTDHTSR
jgi:hypothetical protein